MKLNSILVCLMTFALADKVSANTDDLLNLETGAESKDSMVWPMLPGESLNELAAKFYPTNTFMRRQFTFKTLRLNAESLPNLDASERFPLPTA
ncbi:MAG: hypothetical protein ACT4OH_07535, partial [Methylophilaceae bacterium]